MKHSFNIVKHYEKLAHLLLDVTISALDSVTSALDAAVPALGAAILALVAAISVHGAEFLAIAVLV